MNRTKWFDRKFPVIEDDSALPSLINRLSSAPSRVEELIRSTGDEITEIKPEGKWSIKEHIGHLGDLEPLWFGRMEDFANRLPELRPADLTNEKTYSANHNATEIKNLLQIFREQRRQFIGRLRNLSQLELQSTALHPRLKTSMRIVDHANFVAEHDDHHLASISEIILAYKK